MKRKYLVLLLFLIVFVSYACGGKSVTGIKVEGEASMTVGDTQTLTFTITPVDAKDKSVTWHSSNSLIATVDGGVVTAVSVGTVEITVTTKDGNYSAKLDITVNAAVILPSSVTLNKTSATLNVGETLTLEATVLPSGADQSVTWTSSSSAVTVVNGLVTAVSEGEATITAKTTNNLTATATITVVKPGLSAAVIHTKLNEQLYVYNESSIVNSKITIANGDEVSTTELTYDYNIEAKSINQLKVLSDSGNGTELYIVDGICYINVNGSKTSYEIDSSEMRDVFNRTSFFKYVTSQLPFISDDDFFNGLSLTSTNSDLNNGTFVFELDIVNYEGTTLNLVGAESVTLTVVLVGGSITQFTYTAVVLGVTKYIRVDFLGLTCNVVAPEGFE